MSQINSRSILCVFGGRISKLRLCRLLAVLVFAFLPRQQLIGQTQPATGLQVDHDSWTFKEGAPENVVALAQTTDGFLWLGTSL